MEGELKILQANLRHSRAASAVLTLRMRDFDVALVQEPWVSKGKIMGLGGIGGELIYNRTSEHPRTCIIVKKGLEILPLTNFCSRDLTAVKLRTGKGNKKRELTLGSAYLPYDDPDLPPTRDVRELVGSCRENGLQLIIGMDANAHNKTWGSTNNNERGESLLQFILTNNLDILNVGNEPTFVTQIRKEVIDITLSTTYISNQVSNWHVSDEESCSDHRHINFTVGGITPIERTYRNPRRTDWEAYKADLEYSLNRINIRIRNTTELELMAEQIEDAITIAYKDNCPPVNKGSSRNVPWWNNDLARLRRQTRKTFNKCKKTGKWDEYRKAITEYNKALRKAKRDSWRRHCEDIENTSECARLHKILSKEPHSSIHTLKTETGEYTKTGKETIEELLKVHFPVSTITNLSIADCRGLEIEPEKRALREDWQIAKTVINVNKIKWAINSFKPYKSPGPDNIYPVMLQKGPEILNNKICNILRSSLALGHIPRAWRLIRVVFIPKPGKNGQDRAKSLRPISLMSFMLKTLEKLLDRHIRDDVLINRPLHRDQYAYKAGSSTETALHVLVEKAEYAIASKEVLMCTFMDIEGAFNNTSIESIIKASREKGIDATSCRWIDCMLRNRIIYTSIMGEDTVARVGGGCPQGGVLSPLLWSLVVDELLWTLEKHGHRTLGYADDLVILAQGKHNSTVRERMQSALNVTTKWIRKEGLSANPSKTTIMAFTRRRKLEGIGPLKLLGENIQLSGEVKYLGVILDSKLTWNPQLQRVKNRAEKTLILARRIQGKTWGLKPKMMHWLYTVVVRPMITYASLVWWTKTQQHSAIAELSKVQRLACLAITGAMKTAPTAAIETLLNIPPLHIIIMAEAWMGFSRIKRQPMNSNELGHNRIGKHVGLDILYMPKDYMEPRFSFETNFEVEIEYQNKYGKYREMPGETTWYTDGSKTEHGTGAGVYSESRNSRISIPLGKYTSVFQSEIYAILQCARENNQRTCENRRIRIVTDSQASLRALRNPKVTSRLVWECQKELSALASRGKVGLTWAPGHSGIAGNEKADELAAVASSAAYIGPEPALGVAKTAVRGEVKKWVTKQQKDHWEKITRQQHGKLFIKEPSKKLAEELLKLNRNQLRTVIGLLTGHCALKGHLQKIGTYNEDPRCRLCNKGIETAYHIICECEAMDRKRQTVYGQARLSPQEIMTHPVVKLHKLVQGTGLLEWVM